MSLNIYEAILLTSAFWFILYAVIVIRLRSIHIEIRTEDREYYRILKGDYIEEIHDLERDIINLNASITKKNNALKWLKSNVPDHSDKDGIRSSIINEALK